MISTQANAVNWLNAQVGQHLDYDGQYGQQCVDFFNFYYRQITGRNPYSDGLRSPAVDSARQIWNIRIGDFTYIPDSASLVPQPGDIAIYGSAWGAGNGHVDVVAANGDNGCTFIGENEHNNQNEGVVRVFRTYAQMRGLIGVMRPNWVSPAPAVPMVTQDQLNQLYTINLGRAPDPGAITHYVGNYTYEFVDNDLKNSNEYRVRNTPVPTPTPVEAPKPYVPPAAPEKIVKAEKYEVLIDLPYYANASDTANTNNATGTIKAGVYYVWDKQGTNANYWNLSTDNVRDQNMWVNTTLNKKPLNPPKPVEVPKPEPAKIILQAEKPVSSSSDVMASFKWFYQSHEPVDYIIEKEVTVYDKVHGGVPIRIAPGTDQNGDPKAIEIYGTFIKDGTTYLRPMTGLDEQGQYYYYGLPCVDVYSGLPYLNNEFAIGDKVYYGVDLMIDKTIKTIEGIYKWVRKKL